MGRVDGGKDNVLTRGDLPGTERRHGRDSVAPPGNQAGTEKTKVALNRRAGNPR